MSSTVRSRSPLALRAGSVFLTAVLCVTNVGAQLPSRGALRFDGIDDWCVAGGVPPVASIEAIVRLERNTAGRIAMILGQDDTTCTHGYSWYALADGRFGFEVDIPGCGNSSVASPGFLGESWIHLATTYDGRSQRVYLDGVLVAQRANTTPTANFGFALGSTTNNWPHARIRFDIAELRLWNTVRTPAAIAAGLLEHSVAGTHPELIALYHFDEGSGQLALDASANGFHLQLGTSASADAADPAWVPSYGATPFGRGCAGSGACVPRIDVAGNVRAGGGSFQVLLDTALGGSHAFLCAGMTEAPLAPLPLALDPSGTCNLFVAPEVVVLVPVAGAGACVGTAAVPFAIDPWLPSGLDLAVQWAVIDPAAPGVGLAMSGALALRL